MSEECGVLSWDIILPRRSRHQCICFAFDVHLYLRKDSNFFIFRDIPFPAIFNLDSSSGHEALSQENPRLGIPQLPAITIITVTVVQQHCVLMVQLFPS